MPRLIIAYDPSGKIEMPKDYRHAGIRSAQMDVDLKPPFTGPTERNEVHDIAYRLATLLLEQLR